MAMKNGCNMDYTTTLKPQGSGRMVPAQFARNNLAMGGVNTKMANSGKTSQGATKATSTQKGGKPKY